MTRRLVALWMTLAAWAVPARAQSADPGGYRDGGRRDPFVSLITPRVAPRAAGAAATPRGPGLGGVAIADIAVKGVIRSGATLIALLSAPDGRTFMAKRMDRLADGVVARIDADGVVFSERAADAAGVMRARDVRKPLRAATAGGGQ